MSAVLGNQKCETIGLAVAEELVVVQWLKHVYHQASTSWDRWLYPDAADNARRRGPSVIPDIVAVEFMELSQHADLRWVLLLEDVNTLTARD
ncbi:hypothetical protein JW859_02050 [bacterium]|nr:hypothetical protein [bacterium]